MEQQLKQRIVGAAMLISFAVIFVPMIFEGQSEHVDASISKTNIPDFPKKQFESGILPLPDNEEIERKLKTMERPPVIEPLTIKSWENTALSQPSADVQSISKIAPAWVIQVGSFGQKNNADMFAKKLKTSGFPAFVESINEKEVMIHRVWVGPELDRARANLSKTKIEKTFKLKAIILPYQK